MLARYRRLLHHAASGDLLAKVELGRMYMYGWGVQKDYKKALSLLWEAAKQDHPVAQQALGYFYASGYAFEPDNDFTFFWFRRAAKNGMVLSMFNIGTAYEKGLGVQKNLVAAHAVFHSLSQDQSLSRRGDAQDRAIALSKHLTPNELQKSILLSEVVYRDGGLVPAEIDKMTGDKRFVFEDHEPKGFEIGMAVDKLALISMRVEREISMIK
ncbi:tetratricopeptide repeat protein [Thauera mechernichensis]|uniref:Tetratricopeptide repeat protein n=1 Tax=Thauera mechernichensis TaxID=82788 RepID=A0ABW3WHA0_9RHOO